MTINIYVDASSLACPIGTASDDDLSIELERYINDLIFVKENLDSNIYRFFSSTELPEALFSTGLYPLLNDIKYMLELTGLQEIYQPKDVNRVFDLLFRKMPFLPLPLVGDAKFEKLTVVPRLNHFDNDELRERQLLELGKAAASKRSGWLRAEDLVVFADFVNDDGEDGRAADVRGILREGKFEEGSAFEDVALPIVFSEVFPSVRRLAAFSQELDLGIEASRCRTAEQLSAVLGMAVAQKASKSGLASREWLLGPHFFESMADLHLPNDATAIRCLVDAIVDTILRTNLAQTHHLRKNAGGNSPPQTDGDAVAWRRDVGYEFHLHYWEIGGRCEIASVVVHENMSIPRCHICRHTN
jgi:hypothetical protein